MSAPTYLRRQRQETLLERIKINQQASLQPFVDLISNDFVGIGDKKVSDPSTTQLPIPSLIYHPPTLKLPQVRLQSFLSALAPFPL
jgi:hypothetical protein